MVKILLSRRIKLGSCVSTTEFVTGKGVHARLLANHVLIAWEPYGVMEEEGQALSWTMSKKVEANCTKIEKDVESITSMVKDTMMNMDKTTKNLEAMRRERQESLEQFKQWWMKEPKRRWTNEGRSCTNASRQAMDTDEDLLRHGVAKRRKN